MAGTSGSGGCSRQRPSLLGIAIALQVPVTRRATLICSAAMQVRAQSTAGCCHGTWLSAASHGSKGAAACAALGAAASTAHGSTLCCGPQQQLLFFQWGLKSWSSPEHLQSPEISGKSTLIVLKSSFRAGIFTNHFLASACTAPQVWFGSGMDWITGAVVVVLTLNVFKYQ